MMARAFDLTPAVSNNDDNDQDAEEVRSINSKSDISHKHVDHDDKMTTMQEKSAQKKTGNKILF